MDKIIKLHSREGNNYLKMLKRSNGEESKTYLLKTDSNILRSGYVEDKYKFIDPSGGPLIIEGNILFEANAIVKSIDFIENYGYTITFE